MQTIDPAGALPGGYKGTRHTPGHSTGSAPASMRDSDIGTRERPTHTSRTERPRMFRFREKPRPCQTRAMRPRRSPSWTHAPEWRWEPQRTRIPCGSRDSASVCLCTANSGDSAHEKSSVAHVPHPGDMAPSASCRGMPTPPLWRVAIRSPPSAPWPGGRRSSCWP